jgi:hypothetical protein
MRRYTQDKFPDVYETTPENRNAASGYPRKRDCRGFCADIQVLRAVKEIVHSDETWKWGYVRTMARVKCLSS